MELIYLGRGEGKTTKLIELSSKDGGYIVCHSMNECRRIAGVARDMGMNIPFPICYGEFMERRYNSQGVKNLYIDNVDMLLRSISMQEIKAITLTRGI